MAFCIENFSNLLCFGFATSKSPLHLNLASMRPFQIPWNILDLWNAISKLYAKYEKEIDSITKKITNNGNYCCFRSLMKAIISRCAVLSQTPTYFNFMLMCTLITMTIREKFAHNECFPFAKVTSKCLIAVYERCYGEGFEMSNDIINCYCKYLKEILKSPEDGNKYKISGIKELLMSLIDIDDENFELTHAEMEKLYDSFIVHRDPPSAMSSYDYPMDFDSGWDSTKKDLRCVNRGCKYCCAKCFNNILFYAKINNSTWIYK